MPLLKLTLVADIVPLDGTVEQAAWGFAKSALGELVTSSGFEPGRSRVRPAVQSCAFVLMDPAPAPPDESDVASDDPHPIMIAPSKVRVASRFMEPHKLHTETPLHAGSATVSLMQY